MGDEPEEIDENDLEPGRVDSAVRHGAFCFIRGSVSFKGPTLVFFVLFCIFGQKIGNVGGVRRELDVGCIARNKMEGAM